MIVSLTDVSNPAKPDGQSVPVSNPCLSFWQQTTRTFPLLNTNNDSNVPPSSKYVIIGSGISGALTAFELLENGVNGEEVIILEAREAASGASSRNAGHVRPDAFRGFTAYSKLHGPEQALKIIANERLVLQKVNEFVCKHNVDCDFFYTSTFDVCMTPEFADYEAASLQAYKDAGGDVSHINFYDGAEAQERSKVEGAVAVYEWPAGSSHPAKLAQWLLRSVVDRGVKLFTHCPATAIRSADNNITSKTWSIQTPRGVVTTPTIIHCTNAHASLLLPDLAQHVIPNCAQAHALTPSPAFSAEKTLTKTYSLRYSLLHFFSLIQRQTDGTLILGISRTNPEFSQKTLDGIQSIDDTTFNKEIAEKAFEAFKRLFPSYEGTDGLVHGEGMQHAWAGIIAMTTDSVPFVGEIESLPGQHICAGFGGHGMARIFTCAPGVAKLVLGKQWAETALPECFQISKERLSQLQNKVYAPVW